VKTSFAELEKLMKRLALAVFLCLAPSSVFADIMAYVVGSGSQFGTVDLATGVYTQISPNINDAVGLAIGSGGVLYGINNSGSLMTVNPTTGATTIIGSTGVSGLLVFTALSNGSLYAMDGNEELYSINPSNGHATAIGSTGLPGLGTVGYDNSLAGASNTLYYTLNTSTPFGPNLYTINPLNAQATLVGSTASGIEGSAFAGGTLYGFLNSEEIDSINTANGAATFVANLSPGENLFGGAPNTPAVPEPTSVFLFGTVIAGSVVMMKRKHRAGLKRR
jgi:hypothetical protein